MSIKVASLYADIGVKDNLTPGLQKAKAELSAAELNTIGLKQELATMGMVMGAAGAAAAVMGKVFDETVGDFARYGREVDVFSSALGTTSEQGSRLIQIADDLGISSQELQTALFRAVKNGMEPTVGGLAAMAEQYKNIQDPAEKADFLTKNFGRSSQELARLLEEGAQGIKDRNAAVKDSLILDAQAIKSTRDYEAAIDDWNDQWTATKRNLGEAVLPTVNKVLETVNKSTENIQKDKTAWMNFVPVLNAVHGAYETVKGAIDAKNEKQREEIETAQRAQSEAAKNEYALQHLGDEYGIAAAKTDDWAETTEEDAKKAADALEKAERHMQELMKNTDTWELAYTQATDYQEKVSSVFDELGGMLGELGIEGSQVWDGLLVASGKISPAAIAEFIKIQDVFNTVKDMLAQGMSVDVVVNWVMTQSGLSTMGTGDPFERYNGYGGGGGSHAGWTRLGTRNGPGTGSVWRNNTTGELHYGPVGPGRDYDWQNGANFIVPPGFPMDSYPIRANLTSGEHVQVTPANQSTSQGPMRLHHADLDYLGRLIVASMQMRPQ